MKKITFLVVILFSTINGATYQSKPLTPVSSISTNKSIAIQQKKPLVVTQKPIETSSVKQLIKSHDITEFQPHEHGKPVIFNKLTGRRSIKIKVNSRDLIQTSKHFSLEKKHSKPDKNVKITWKVRIKGHGKGWIRVRDKDTGTQIYHFDIENNHIKKSHK